MNDKEPRQLDLLDPYKSAEFYAWLGSPPGTPAPASIREEPKVKKTSPKRA